MLNKELVIDSFAGGGGASLGIELAIGRPVDIAINHDQAAIEMHRANHPGTFHYCEDIYQVDPAAATAGRPVGLLWASPDCTHHSKAKGGKPVSNQRRGLAWVVIKWARRVRPRLIILENVPEFKDWGPLDKTQRPVKAKKGKTFTLWANQLRRLGYRVEFKNLVAADYGVPTSRTRLFMIARCDGLPIVWPRPTHGAGLLPCRAAAECIDWSLPCPSIFLSRQEAHDLRLNIRRPLQENTMRRIAKGMYKFVIDSSDPFIVTLNHSGDGFRGGGIHEPLRTITAARDAHGLVMPLVVGIDNKSCKSGHTWPIRNPLNTITLENRFSLVAPFLTKYYGAKGNETRGQGLAAPLRTLDTQPRFSLAVPFLTKFYGTNTGSDMRDPLPTVTAAGQHVGEVRAFLVKYYGTAVGQDPRKPLHTITSKQRLGLVTVAGTDYQIVDIGMRMLRPRELARAQGFPDDYILTGTRTSQIAMIGNSVCPPLAAELVRANCLTQQKDFVA